MTTPQFKFNPFTKKLDYAGTGGSGPVTYYSLSPYIVGGDSHAQYTTIQAAITQATSDGAANATPLNVYIKPGTYAGNFTIPPGISVIGLDESGYPAQVVPSVKITGNITISGNANCKLQNLNIAPSSGNIITITATGSNISCSNCYFNAGSAFFAALSNSASFYFNNCDFNTGLFTLSGNSKNYSFIFNDCNIDDQGSAFNSTTSNTVDFEIYDSVITGMNIVSTSGTTSSISIDIFDSNITSSSTLGTSGAGDTVSVSLNNCSSAQTSDIFTIGNASDFVSLYNSRVPSTVTAGSGKVTGATVALANDEVTLAGQSLVLNSPATPTVLGSGPELTAYSGDPTGAVTAEGGSLSMDSSGASAGYYRSTAGSGNTWSVIGGGGGGGFTSIAVQTFTSSGTYTPTGGMLYCTIEVVGGGGGGGGVSNPITLPEAGGGGGGGGYARLTASAATIGASQAVTIGAGGAAGANTGTDGGTGGTTSLGALVSATGGIGGAGSNSAGGAGTVYIGVGGAGGVGSSGDINSTGGAGQPGLGISGGAIGGYGTLSGGGGCSFFGGGALSVQVGNSVASVAGNNGSAYGGGGSGAAGSVLTNNAAAGGSGSAGVIIITEYV